MIKPSKMSYVTETTFKKKMQKIDTSFAHLDKKIDKSVAQLDKKIDMSVARLDKKIDMSVARLDKKIDESVDRLDKKIDSSNMRIDAIALELVHTNQRLERVENTMATKSDVTLILDRIDHVIKKISIFEQEEGVQNVHLNEVRLQVNDHEKRLKVLEA